MSISWLCQAGISSLIPHLKRRLGLQRVHAVALLHTLMQNHCPEEHCMPPLPRWAGAWAPKWAGSLKFMAIPLLLTYGDPILALFAQLARPIMPPFLLLEWLIIHRVKNFYALRFKKTGTRQREQTKPRKNCKKRERSPGSLLNYSLFSSIKPKEPLQLCEYQAIAFAIVVSNLICDKIPFMLHERRFSNLKTKRH